MTMSWKFRFRRVFCFKKAQAYWRKTETCFVAVLVTILDPIKTSNSSICWLASKIVIADRKKNYQNSSFSGLMFRFIGFNFFLLLNFNRKRPVRQFGRSCGPLSSLKINISEEEHNCEWSDSEPIRSKLRRW